MEPEKDEKKEPSETVRISLEADPVEQQRVCQACYWKGRADATWVFLVVMLVLTCAMSVARRLINVTE